MNVELIANEREGQQKAGNQRQRGPIGYPRQEETCRRIGEALGVSPSAVRVERTQPDRLGASLRCTGSVGNTRFYAKLYLMDPHPVRQQFALFGEPGRPPVEICRPVEQQIATEWNRLQQVSTLVGNRNTPVPLGFSLEHRVMVVEEVRGASMDGLLGKGIARRAWRKSLEAAVFHAGAWLRRLHQMSAQNCESIFPIEVLEQARRQGDRHSARPQLERVSALAPLQAVCRQIGTRTPVRAPLAVNHGDFKLRNLLWNPDPEHLWVVDFEFSTCRSVLHDLTTMIVELRGHLFHPLASAGAVRRLEESFWCGYGCVTENVRMLVSAAAAYQLLVDRLPKMAPQRSRPCLLASVKNSFYRRFVQPLLVSRIMRTI